MSSAPVRRTSNTMCQHTLCQQIWWLALGWMAMIVAMLTTSR
jgi:hypothetical protein